MKRMKLSSIALSLLLPFSALAKNSYPLIQEVRGKVLLVGMDNKSISAKKGMALKGRAEIETGPQSTVKISWDGQRELTLFENSQIRVPAIAWETGEAPVVLLQRGQMQWQALNTKTYNVALHSDLFEFIAPAATFKISYNPEKAFSEIQVQEGQVDFSCMNGDEAVPVKKGQRAGFQGILEEGKVAYDILLKGRKIPRGKLTAVTEIDPAELQAQTKAEAALKKADLARAQKKRLEAGRQRLPGQICAAPFAKFNECAWTCEGNPKGEKKLCQVTRPQVGCVRRRCNANGEWAEDTRLDAEKAQVLCKAQPQVAPCDY